MGEVVYEGGGNFILLFKDADTFRKVTYEFTKSLLENIGTLRVLGTYIEDVDFSDYQGDQRRLYEQHRINEAQESNVMPWSCLPIVQVDRKTSMPLVGTVIGPEGIEKHSRESLSKLEKYHSEINRMKLSKYKNSLTEIEREFYTENENKLDNLITEKGKDSKIAVLYIDGNNMGAKVQNAIKGKKSYKDCVAALRAFSDDIQRIYVEDGISKVMGSMKNDGHSYRIIVFAVFNSHAPYSDAYRIAEEACESGKKKMKDLKMTSACFIDYHFCQGAIGISLEKIREEECGDVISKPWLMCTSDQPLKYKNLVTEWNDIYRVIQILKAFGRSNVKGLMQAALNSEVEVEMELNRLYAHMSQDKKTQEFENEWDWMKKLPQKREMLYDVVSGYDMWFKDM